MRRGRIPPDSPRNEWRSVSSRVASRGRKSRERFTVKKSVRDRGDRMSSSRRLLPFLGDSISSNARLVVILRGAPGNRSSSERNPAVKFPDRTYPYCLNRRIESAACSSRASLLRAVLSFAFLGQSIQSPDSKAAVSKSRCREHRARANYANSISFQI